MLPYRLAKLKQELESQLYLNKDDKKSLQVLKVLDSDPNFKEILNDEELMKKSFAVAPRTCPQCGRPM
jgi:hypothetical protein